MNVLSLIQIALAILSATLPQIKAADGKSDVGLASIAESVENAIAELKKVHSTPVTHEQLESLKVPQLW